MPNFIHPIINSQSEKEQKLFFHSTTRFFRLARYSVVMPLIAIAAPVVSLIGLDEKQWIPKSPHDKYNATFNNMYDTHDTTYSKSFNTHKYVIQSNPLTYLLQFLEEKQIKAVQCLGKQTQTSLNSQQKAFIFLSQTAFILPRILTALVNPILEITNCLAISEKQEKSSAPNKILDAIKAIFTRA